MENLSSSKQLKSSHVLNSNQNMQLKLTKYDEEKEKKNLNEKGIQDTTVPSPISSFEDFNLDKYRLSDLLNINKQIQLQYEKIRNITKHHNKSEKQETVSQYENYKGKTLTLSHILDTNKKLQLLLSSCGVELKDLDIDNKQNSVSQFENIEVNNLPSSSNSDETQLGLTQNYKRGAPRSNIFYECDICKSIFLKKSKLKNHFQTFMNKNWSKCEICKLLFPTRHVSNGIKYSHVKCDACSVIL